jgi:4-carboxymuconolactone decarboxylase
MRLKPIPPEQLTPEQRPVYDDMKAGIEKGFTGFKAIREDGALIGPWTPWLHAGPTGKAIWELTKALSSQSTLPEPIRQIAILVTGARFRAGYEIYAHVLVARQDGLPEDKLGTIVAGQRPPDLTREEGIAYDVAAALNAGGVLPETTYQAARAAFGHQGASELIYLVGLYCLVSVTLNGFDVQIPEDPNYEQ